LTAIVPNEKEGIEIPSEENKSTNKSPPNFLPISPNTPQLLNQKAVPLLRLFTAFYPNNCTKTVTYLV